MDTALGMAINVDFTQGAVNSFLASGGTPTYSSSGVAFTVARSGDAPQLASIFYIMFGRVELTMKCAPGAGIVSSLVLQSDDLDEIDMEWLGADASEVQTNYFGKGQHRLLQPRPAQPGAQQPGPVRHVHHRLVRRPHRVVRRRHRRAHADLQRRRRPVPADAHAGQVRRLERRRPSNAAGTIQWAAAPPTTPRAPSPCRSGPSSSPTTRPALSTSTATPRAPGSPSRPSAAA